MQQISAKNKSTAPIFDGCWWMSPVTLMLCVHVPICIGSYLIPAETFQTLWKEPKYIDQQMLLLGLGCIFAFLVGYFLNAVLLGHNKSRAIRIYDMTATHKELVEVLFRVGMFLFLFGTAAWFGIAIKRGLSLQYLIAFFHQESGASSALRHSFFKTVPGLTTSTQFGMAAMIIGTCAYILKPKRYLSQSLVAIVVIDAVRSFLLSERLSLIEVFVPAVVIWIHLKISRSDPSPALQSLLRLGPVLGVGGLYILFTISEAFRSWTFYSKEGGSLLSFGAFRLVGYYANAINNSALVFKAVDMPDVPYITQQWLWQMPLMGELGGVSAKMMNEHYMDLLKGAGNPEFNNASAFLLPLHDYGVLGGLIYWLLTGFLFATIYRAFKRYQVMGMFLYPIIFVGLLEMSRLMYLSAGRTTPSLVLLLLAVILCSQIESSSPLRALVRSRKQFAAPSSVQEPSRTI